jgi:hypothetical protein
MKFENISILKVKAQVPKFNLIEQICKYFSKPTELAVA